MGIIDKMRKQKAVYWAPAALDRSGSPTYDDPVELTCRWDDGRVEVKLPTGDVVHASATVYVSADVEVKGMLMLGALLSGTPSDPRDSSLVGLAHEINMFTKNPDLKAKKFLRTAFLK